MSDGQNSKAAKRRLPHSRRREAMGTAVFKQVLHGGVIGRKTYLQLHHKANIWGLWSNTVLGTRAVNRCSLDWAVWPQGMLGGWKKKKKKKGSSIWWNGHLANCWVEIFWFGFAWQPAARERFHISENLREKKSQASWESKIQTFYKSVQKKKKNIYS